ncbi:MAG: protein kinase [Wujia sp.]
MTKEGTILDGKYEILAEVGRGGMSIVYLARDKRLNKQWAVKEIKNDGKKSAKTLLKGLEREANILKNVDHPVLPRIVDIINQDGTIYVVMDYVEGDTVQDRLKEQGALPQDLVVEWGLQLASALHYLHNMNPPVIYRDMKPSNVMIKPEGGVKLIDFGTAKEYDVENNADTTALGTRGYAAPEQFGDSKGRGIYNTDARTDIYNLGATLYHMVTGKNPCEPPYEIKAIREWNPMLSSGLEKILLKCTQADPNDRYQNCSELMYALEHYHELDDSYKKANKKKLTIFSTSVVLAIAAAITSGVGHAGMKRMKMDNYNTYIETGNEYRVDGNYSAAVEEYKKAFELDGSDEEAYERYIQTYIDAGHEAQESGETAEIELETGLNVVANRIKSKHDDVDQNSAVLYKLGLAYFEEQAEYGVATKYFGMIDESDPVYGKLAKYYKTIAQLRSDGMADASALLEEIYNFAIYNQNNFANDDAKKFVNYRIIGEIYSSNISKIEDIEVGQQAAEILEQAIVDLESYAGPDLSKEDVSDLNYRYDDYLIVIYEQLAKNAKNDEKLANEYFAMTISSCEDYIDLLKMKVERNPGIGLGGESVSAYNQSYYNKMMVEVRCYDAQGKVEEAIDTYKKAEKLFGTKNEWSDNVYAEHLDYLYHLCEAEQQDPTKWAKELPELTKQLLDVYKDGSSVEDIMSNKTWYKRKDTMDMLKKNQTQSTDDAQMGE